MAVAAMRAAGGRLADAAAAAHRTAAALLDAAPQADPAMETALQTIPRWHFAMLNDSERNEAFAAALRRLVVPGSHVLDIGSGTGLLAMMAADAGAGLVTTCESNPLLAEIARQTIERHGLGDVVKVVPRLSTDLVVGRDLPVPADLIVSEIVDCGLIGEGLLPAVRHARTQLLAPGGRLVPAVARLVGCLIESEAVSRLNRVTSAAGYDVRLLNRFATPGHFPVRLNTWPHRLISRPVELLSFDLARDPLEDGGRRIPLIADADGTAHGVVAWFELDLGDGVVLRNAPDVLDTHWMQAFVAWDRGVTLRAGDALYVDLRWQAERLTATPFAPTTTHRKARA